MASTSKIVIWRLAAIVAGVLAGQGLAVAGGQPKHLAPIPADTVRQMAARDTTPTAPILIRLYKKESELEVWKKARNGRFVLLKTFPICRWSGQLGPKKTLGDRQAPEGFYSVPPKQMNPNSSYHLSFDIGFPNAYDLAHGGSGSFLMVHGNCTSAGCYAMTDKGVEEIYALAREAFAGGQRAFQFQAFPFRMTAQNLARHRSDRNIDFWRQLKEGSDRFEATGEEPAVSVAAGRYVFSPFKDAAKETLAKARLTEEKARIATLVTEGGPVVRTTYEDGGQHPSFRLLARQGAPLGTISRPEALAFAGREVVLIPARRKSPACVGDGCATQAAEAKDKAAQPDNPTAPIVLAALSPGYLPLFSPAPLTEPMEPVAAQFTISGSMRILPAGLASMRFEVVSQ